MSINTTAFHRSAPRIWSGEGTTSLFTRASYYLSSLLLLGLLMCSLVATGFYMEGYRFVYTRGHSMEPTFSPGSLLLARQVGPEQIRIGDIILFNGDPFGPSGVVHRVIEIDTQGSSPIALTQGDNNDLPDSLPIVMDKPVTRVISIVPHLGWLATPTFGWTLIAAAALAYVGWHFRRALLNEKPSRSHTTPAISRQRP